MSSPAVINAGARVATASAISGGASSWYRVSCSADGGDCCIAISSASAQYGSAATSVVAVAASSAESAAAVVAGASVVAGAAVVAAAVVAGASVAAAGASVVAAGA